MNKKNTTKETSLTAPSQKGMAGRNFQKQKPKNMRKTARELFHYISKKSWIFVGVALLFSILGAIFQVFIPKLLGNATTEIFHLMKSGKDAPDFSILWNILTVAFLLYFFSFIFDNLRQWLMTDTAQKMSQKLRSDFKKKMNMLPVSYFDNHSHGNIMSIAMNDIDNISSNLQTSLVQFVSMSVGLIVTLAIMFTISWQLTFIALLSIPASIFVATFIGPKIGKYQKAYMQDLGKLNGHIEEIYNGHSVVKSFNKEQKSISQYEEYNDPIFRSGWKAKFAMGMMMPIVFFLQNLAYVVIAIFGGLRVASGQVSIGGIQSILQYSSQLSFPAGLLPMALSSLFSALASAERVFEILSAQEISTEKVNIPFKNNGAKVEFEHVQFGYDKAQPVIRDFNLSVKKGELIAIVGHTGAGKTTLINLLERFYDVNEGSIYLDGIELRDMSQEELHTRLAMVLQDTWLFSDTIYNNILYGNSDATKEQVIKASKAAYVDDFIHKLPLGYDTVLNENANNISQGQGQLISIARALLANPEILILDEATSNVDTRTELLFQKAVKKLLYNRTSFVVAHRLSTIRNANKILVMDKGSIVEMGSHEELLAKKGVYSDIYYSQFLNEAV
jgi:ATP-binding cassette subfamily B multidrug efflux pump